MLRWGQKAFHNFRVVPPGTGICTRSTSSTSRAWSRSATASPSRTRWSAPTRTRRWSTGSACSAGASAGSRPRRRCSASRSHARAAGRRLPAHRRAARGRDRDRPRAHVTEMLRKNGVVGKFVEFFGHGLARSRSPTAPRSRTCRRSTARPAASSRSTRRRSSYLRLTGRERRADRAGRGLLQGDRLFHEPDDAPTYRRCSSSTSGRWSRAWPGRAARRTASRSRTRRRRSRLARDIRRRGAPDEREPATRRSPTRSRRATRRPSRPRAASRSPSPTPPRSRSPRPSPPRRGRGRRTIRSTTARRDRRDHELHEHLEPAVMIGGRPAREEGGRARARAQAVGEDEPRAGLEGRDRLLDRRGPAALPRRARLPDGRLRLHDLHRQLRPAAGADLRGGRRGRPGRLLRALGQPQLRGAHPSRGEGELPRLAAAGRRLRARRPDRHRSGQRAARAGLGRQRTSTSRDIWPSATRSRRRSRIDRAARCSATPTPTSSPATRLAALPVPEGELFAWEPTRPTCASRRTSRTCRRRRAVRRHRGRALLVDARRHRHDRPHLAGRLDRATRPPGTYLIEHGVERSTSTPTARAAATTR